MINFSAITEVILIVIWLFLMFFISKHIIKKYPIIEEQYTLFCALHIAVGSVLLGIFYVITYLGGLLNHAIASI